MASVTIKNNISKKILERAKTQLCLHCDSKAKKRGLCDRHYQQFIRARNLKPKKQWADFEVRQIKDGKILNVGQVHEIKSDSPFAEAS